MPTTPLEGYMLKYSLDGMNFRLFLSRSVIQEDRGILLSMLSSILGMIPVREGSDMEESADFISLISAFCSGFPFFNVYSEKSVVK